MKATITASELRTLLAEPKRSKYGAKKTDLDGVVFDSRREANRWAELRLLEKAGEISNLQRQPQFLLFGSKGPVLIKSKRYPNGRRAKWIGDFSYFCSKRNKLICEDAKGVRTPAFVLKRAIVEACYPGLEIVEI